MSTTVRGQADHRAVIDRDYHNWLTLKSRQLADRISRLRAEGRARRGLPPRVFNFLLDSIDELARVRGLIDAVEGGKTERELHPRGYAMPTKEAPDGRGVR